MRYTLAGLSDIALSGSYVKPGGTATYVRNNDEDAPT